MRVAHKIPLVRYAVERRFAGRIDRDPSDPHMQGQFVLISDDFFYFGHNAIDIERIPKRHLSHEFEKRGPNYRRDFAPEFVTDFDEWLHREFAVGVHGSPCAPYSPNWNSLPRSSCLSCKPNPPCPPKRAEKPPAIC